MVYAAGLCSSIMESSHRRHQSAGLRANCDCGLPPYVGISRSAKNPNRPYANCSRFPAPQACKYFTWLDAYPANISSTLQPSLPGPPTPERVAVQPRSSTVASTASSSTAASVAKHNVHAAPSVPDTSQCFSVLLLVVHNTSPLSELLPQTEERVRLVLLPASAHPPPYCTQRLAQQVAERRLPRAPVSLRSLQPPFVTIRHCPGAYGLAAALGWAGGKDAEGLFVLDTETTGLSGRDYIHQIAVLNLKSCQMLTAFLRTCPRSCGPVAAQVSGVRNQALHHPDRPTFGQLAPLLHAFIEEGSCSKHQPPIIVAHNGAYDARMLIAEWARRDLPMPTDWRLLDTLPLARESVAGCESHKLGALRRHFGIRLAPGEAEHDAGVDVTILAQLLPVLLKASGAGSLRLLLDGTLRRKNGERFARTFGDIKARMRGATTADDGIAGTAVAFTCDFCHARIVA